MYEIGDDIATRADDAGGLVQSAAHQGGRRIEEGRNCLSSALKRGRDIYEHTRRRAIRDARTANGLLHGNPYQSVLIGIGIGALLGYLASRRGSCNSG